MIELEIDDTTKTGRIILRPNHSWSWRYNLYLLYTLATISGLVSMGFLLAGAWIILPFSIIELSVLAACMYYCTKQCNQQEVITVSDEAVQIELGHKRVEETRLLPATVGEVSRLPSQASLGQRSGCDQKP